nr:15239_t:CDS:2 [Entrophospora candida]
MNIRFGAEKRAQYDQWSTAQGGPTGTCGFPGGSDANYCGFSGFSEELFSSIFDGVKTGYRQPYTTGSDIEISFMELVKGAKQTVAIETIAFCKACNGLGTKISPGNRCPTCSGIGIEDEQKSNRLDKTNCKYRAIIDGYIVMSMIDGNVELKVPEASQSDQHIVLKTWHKQWQFPR